MTQRDGLDEENFHRACVVLMYYVINLRTTCADASLHAQTYEYFARETQQRVDGQLKLSEEELELMVDAVAHTYKAENYAKVRHGYHSFGCRFRRVLVEWCPRITLVHHAFVSPIADLKPAEGGYAPPFL